MARYLTLFLSIATLTGCGGGGLVKATSDLDRGFKDLGCLSRDFKGSEPCKPDSG